MAETSKLEMTRLGGYTIVRKLAKGGMAEIYLARSAGPEGFEKLVVLKRILPKYAENPRFVQLFLDEAKLGASLDHPHIVHVYDMGRADGHYFFTMEYVHGQDTRSILRKASRTKGRDIPIHIAVHIARTMAAALHHAHERKRPDGTSRDVVHRDVSPSNILVSYDGAIKLADFGVAKAATSSVRTRTGALKGKVGYMSPEQARGMAIDRRSDIFSLGVVLWELVAMRRLFKSDNDLATIQAIINTPPPSLSELRPECPPELDRIARRALEKDPATRYQNAQQLQHDLDELARELKLDQSSIALSRYMNDLFDEEIAAWREAQSAGATVTDFIVAHSGPSTPVSESELSLEDPGDPEEDDDEIEDDDLEEPSERTTLPPQQPRAGVIANDEPEDATDFGPPPTMEQAKPAPPPTERAPTNTPRPLAATVARPKAPVIPTVIPKSSDTEREDNPFDNATTRLRPNPMTGGPEPSFESPTKVGQPVFADEAPTVSAPPDILQRAFAETDETAVASPRYSDPKAMPDSAFPTPPPGQLDHREAPTTPFAKPTPGTGQFPFTEKKPPPNLPSVPHVSNLAAHPDPSVLVAPQTPPVGIPAMPGVVPKAATPNAPTAYGQPPPSAPPPMPEAIQPPMLGGPGAMQPGMSGQMQHMQPGSMPGMQQGMPGQPGVMPVGSFPPGTMMPNQTGQVPGLPGYPGMYPHTPPVGIPSYPTTDFDPNLSIDLAPQRRWLMIAGIAVAVAVIAILLVVIFSRGSEDEVVPEEEPTPAPAPKVEPKPVPKPPAKAEAPKPEPKPAPKPAAKPAVADAGSAGSAETKPEPIAQPVAETKPLPKITKQPPTLRRPAKRR